MILLSLTAAALLGWTGAMAVLAADGLRDNLKPCDTAVVLGARVYNSGAPSRSLQTRLDRAAELYREGWFPHILVSGGDQGNGYHQSRVMAEYLRGKGVPPRNITLDLYGTNTYRTAANTALWMEEQEAQSVVVITQFFHIPRTRLPLRRSGVPEVASARGDPLSPRDISGLFRDTAALASYLFRDYSPAALRRGTLP